MHPGGTVTGGGRAVAIPVVTPSQLRQMLKALGIGLLLFALSMIFRKDP